MAAMHAARVEVSLLAVAFAGLLAGPVSGQAQDAARGAAVLAEAREALGGGDKLGEIKRLQANGTIRRGAGTVNLTGELEFFIELPGRFRRDETLLINAQGQEIERKEVVNGADSWEETKRGGGLVDLGGGGGDLGGADAAGADAGGRAGGQPAAAEGAPSGRGQTRGGIGASPEAQHLARKTEFARVLLALLLTAETPVNWIGTAKSPDGEADVLEIKTADGTATRLLIDAKSRMPLMVTWTGVPQDAFAALVGRSGFAGRGGRGGRGGGRGAEGRTGEPPAAASPEGAGGRRGGGPGGLAPTMLQMFLSDYRVVGGVKLPHLMTRGANGEITEEWIVRNYRINSNFNSNTFAK